MCGITASIALDPTIQVDPEVLQRTCDAMANRGPDAEGQWLAPDRRIGLGHRRLSIIDLSEAANQPLLLDQGRSVLVFNGEIYNYRELRTELTGEGVTFQTDSDTEVLARLLDRRGIEGLAALRGMFAFVYHDSSSGSTIAARDPYGIKPLYYTCAGGVLHLASTVKALVAGGSFTPVPDVNAAHAFLNWGHIPEPMTVYRDVCCLPAGHVLEVNGTRMAAPRPWMAIADCWSQPADGEVDIPAELAGSIAAHTVADVPVAVFLSAGVDSTLMAWQLATLMPDQPPTAITITFDEFRGTDRDEAGVAAQTAQTLGLEHHVHTVSRESFLNDLDDFFAAMDQPTIDGVNSYLVSKAAHAAGFKTVLSGLGGDELFAGYDSFADVPAWLRYARRSAPLRPLQPAIGLGVRTARRLPPVASRLPAKLAGALAVPPTLSGMYLLRRGIFMPNEVDSVLRGELGFDEQASSYDPILTVERALAEGLKSDYAQIAVLESSLYMRNQLLRDTDWASMRHSLEIRVPLVDALLCRQLAPSLVARTDGVSKSLMRSEASRQVLEPVLNRPKSGFFTPVDQWIAESGLVGHVRYPGAAARDWALYVYKRYVGS